MIISKPQLRPTPDKGPLRSASEMSVAMACIGMVHEFLSSEQAFRKREISWNAFCAKTRRILAELTNAAELTVRFDIVAPVLAYGRYSPSFWRWLNWWEDYLRGLGESRMNNAACLAKAGGSVEEVRPKGDWISYRQTPAFTIVVK